jgi:transposase
LESFFGSGQPERRTHDDKRHGTTAALDIATGKVIGKCYARYRAKEFLSFLSQTDRVVPSDLDVHLVMDNDARHKTAAIRTFLAKRPHWQVHLTPTGASRVNQVERLFADLTERQIRRGVHRSTQELQQAIEASITTVNADPKPFRRTESADDILAAVHRCCLRTLDTATARSN